MYPGLNVHTYFITPIVIRWYLAVEFSIRSEITLRYCILYIGPDFYQISTKYVPVDADYENINCTNYIIFNELVY